MLEGSGAAAASSTRTTGAQLAALLASGRIRGTSRSTARPRLCTSRVSSRRGSPASKRPRRASDRRLKRRRGARRRRRQHDARQARSSCSTATSPTPRTRAAACRTTSAPPSSRPTARAPGAVEAGQHRARHAAQRRQPQLPEHGARDQLAHRSRDEAEDYARRIDHDNAGVASAAAYDRFGVYLFVALETSREVAVVDAHDDVELFRFAGRPGAAGPARFARRRCGSTSATSWTARSASSTWRRCMNHGPVERAAARDARSRRDGEAQPRGARRQAALLRRARHAPRARRYMSCASCHNDGGHDGRVWDLTGMGEGLRNTISLRGRAGGARASCTGAPTSTRSRTSRARSARSRAAPA